MCTYDHVYVACIVLAVETNFYLKQYINYSYVIQLIEKTE